MDKKLTKALKDANKELKRRNFLMNYQIVIDGDFTTEYNELRLERNGRCFPIADVGNESEAVAAIQAYLSGFSHGKDKSYVLLCDWAGY